MDCSCTNGLGLQTAALVRCTMHCSGAVAVQTPAPTPLSPLRPSGPREVSAAPGATAPYPLTFRPLAPGTYNGRLELFIPSTGERCAGTPLIVRAP